MDLYFAFALGYTQHVSASWTTEKTMSLALLKHVLIALGLCLSLLHKVMELVIFHGALICVFGKHSKGIEND